MKQCSNDTALHPHTGKPHESRRSLTVNYGDSDNYETPVNYRPAGHDYAKGYESLRALVFGASVRSCRRCALRQPGKSPNYAIDQNQTLLHMTAGELVVFEGFRHWHGCRYLKEGERRVAIILFYKIAEHAYGKEMKL